MYLVLERKTLAYKYAFFFYILQVDKIENAVKSVDLQHFNLLFKKEGGELFIGQFFNKARNVRQSIFVQRVVNIFSLPLGNYYTGSSEDCQMLGSYGLF